MKQIAILFLAFTAFAACGTNFLRNLAASVTGVKFGDEKTCVTELTKALKITLTLSEGLQKDDTITANFQPDVTSPSATNVFEYGYKETATANPPKTITLTSSSSSSTQTYLEPPISLINVFAPLSSFKFDLQALHFN